MSTEIAFIPHQWVPLSNPSLSISYFSESASPAASSPFFQPVLPDITVFKLICSLSLGRDFVTHTNEGFHLCLRPPHLAVVVRQGPMSHQLSPPTCTLISSCLHQSGSDASDLGGYDLWGHGEARMSWLLRSYCDLPAGGGAVWNVRDAVAPWRCTVKK